MLKHEFDKLYGELKSQYVTDTTSDKGVRYYKFINDKRYRSVTTMLSEMTDKSWLNNWYIKEGKEACIAITKESCEYGSQMHANCESYLKGEPIPVQSGEGYELFLNIKPLLAAITDVWIQEAVVWTHQYQLAGRLDCLGIYDNKLTLIDFKSARKLKTLSGIFNYIMQTTLYCFMLKEMIGIEVEQIAILIGQRVNKEGVRPPAQKFIFSVKDQLPALMRMLQTFDKLVLNMDRIKNRLNRK